MIIASATEIRKDAVPRCLVGESRILDRRRPVEPPFALTCYILYDMKSWKSAPEISIATDTVYRATMETNRGTIELELYPEHAPKTVNNFVFLAQEGFYDGIAFHRVIDNFMIQGGDPTGTGRGGPGYKFEDELRGNPLKHESGVISMANAGPNTNGSQFFITHSPQPHLDGRHTVFGKVTSGKDVVDSIEQGDTIKSVTVSEA
jgi:peptidyl-prolyl cis-trans isomerase B (cyclophilin B)